MLDIKLYQIPDILLEILENNTNEDGEISEEVYGLIDEILDSEKIRVENLIEAYKTLESLEAGLKNYKKDIARKVKKAKSGQERIKFILDRHLQKRGLPRMELGIYTLAYRASNSIELKDGVDIKKVPIEFLKIQIELRKTDIKNAMKLPEKKAILEQFVELKKTQNLQIN